ncbi:MAG: hypothetical protein Q4E88_05335 [Coriobacteriia bacterium]|nr:hypothetical protein [Coriobacteriia bacterium]
MSDNRDSKKKLLMSFPIVIVCLIIYLILGFCCNLWYLGWIVFLIIPVYYWTVNYIYRDK